MKKLFLLVSALVLTAACAAPSTNQVAPSNTNVSNTPAPVAMTETDAIAKEKAIWDTIKNKDYAAFGNLLADDQLEVTGEGVLDKAGSITNVKDFEPTDVAFSDWKFMSIDKDAFVVVYSVKIKGKYKGKEFPEESARASSAWVQREGKWLAIYHQECPVKPPMPMPPPTKNPAKTTATPVGTPAPAPTAGPDATANEKTVWDLFKAKNYDGFAALLSANFIEVEPEGMYDKTAAVEGLRGFDVSKAVLSDWKSLKLDDDASIVTYVLKLPAMPGMPAEPNGVRHSSIWARQAGTWLAILHHGGTAVMTPGAMAAPAGSPSPKVAASPAASASPAVKAPMKKM